MPAPCSIESFAVEPGVSASSPASSPSPKTVRARGSSAPRLGDAARQDAPVAAHRRRRGARSESLGEPRAGRATASAAAAARSSRPTSAYARGGQRGGGRSRHRRRQSRSRSASPLGTRASSARPKPAETIASAVAAARPRAASGSPRAAARADAAAPAANETQSAAQRTADPAARTRVPLPLDVIFVSARSVSIARGPRWTPLSSVAPRIGTISARTSGGTSASHDASSGTAPAGPDSSAVAPVAVPKNSSSSAAHASGARRWTPPGAFAAHVPALARVDAASLAVARSIPEHPPDRYASRRYAPEPASEAEKSGAESVGSDASSNQASLEWWSRNAAASAATRAHVGSAEENCDEHAIAARTQTLRRSTRHGRSRTSSLHASYAACAARSRAMARATCAADKRGAASSERGVGDAAGTRFSALFGVFLLPARAAFDVLALSLAAAAASDGYRDASLACRALRKRYSHASSSSSASETAASPRGESSKIVSVSSSARASGATLSHPHHARSEVCARSHSSSGDAASAAAESTISIASARAASPTSAPSASKASPPSASASARVAGEVGAPGITSRTELEAPLRSDLSSAVTRAPTGECRRVMSPTQTRGSVEKHVSTVSAFSFSETSFSETNRGVSARQAIATRAPHASAIPPSSVTNRRSRNGARVALRTAAVRAFACANARRGGDDP